MPSAQPAQHRRSCALASEQWLYSSHKSCLHHTRTCSHTRIVGECHVAAGTLGFNNQTKNSLRKAREAYILLCTNKAPTNCLICKRTHGQHKFNLWVCAGDHWVYSTRNSCVNHTHGHVHRGRVPHCRGHLWLQPQSLVGPAANALAWHVWVEHTPTLCVVVPLRYQGLQRAWGVIDPPDGAAVLVAHTFVTAQYPVPDAARVKSRAEAA